MGGRTGLTDVSAALCFIASLFLGPIVSCVPMSAIAPILIFVGLSMIENIMKRRKHRQTLITDTVEREIL